MQRDKHDVTTLVKNVLGAVSVMKVDVQYGDTFGTLGNGLLCSNGGVVEIAIAAHVFTRCVMAGRSAQGKSTVMAFIDQCQSGEGDVCTGFHRLPSSGGNRGAGVHGVETELAVDERRDLLVGQVTHWPYQR
ncbi:hypothetical protein D3C72_1656480 [compost metagenome]